MAMVLDRPHRQHKETLTRITTVAIRAQLPLHWNSRRQSRTTAMKTTSNKIWDSRRTRCLLEAFKAKKFCLWMPAQNLGTTSRHTTDRDQDKNMVIEHLENRQLCHQMLNMPSIQSTAVKEMRIACIRRVTRTWWINQGGQAAYLLLMLKDFNRVPSSESLDEFPVLGKRLVYLTHLLIDLQISSRSLQKKAAPSI